MVIVARQPDVETAPSRVRIRQCPAGAASWTRWPPRTRPQRRVISVVTPLSSRKIRLSPRDPRAGLAPLRSPELTRFAILLAGVDRLFLSRRPRSLSTFHKRPMLTSRCCCSNKRNLQLRQRQVRLPRDPLR